MLLALGDWTDKSGQTTAHGYAASKYTLSLRAKHAILSGARDVQSYQSWEEIPRVAADVVAEALRLDCINGCSDLRPYGSGSGPS